jgi:hypothetical protein
MVEGALLLPATGPTGSSIDGGTRPHFDLAIRHPTPRLARIGSAAPIWEGLAQTAEERPGATEGQGVLRMLPIAASDGHVRAQADVRTNGLGPA